MGNVDSRLSDKGLAHRLPWNTPPLNLGCTLPGHRTDDGVYLIASGSGIWKARKDISYIANKSLIFMPIYGAKPI